MLPSLTRRLLAEFVGTAGLVGAVIGSGIAAQRLSPGDVGLQLLENSIATTLALVAIHGTAAARPHAVPIAVGSYIGAAYWFTSSTSFANPAVTGARTLSGSFAGIAPASAPASAPAFVAAQLAGAVLATLFLGAVLPGWAARPPSAPGPTP